MALSTATITFDIADQLGVDFDPRRTKVWVTTNTDTVIDTVGDKIRLGSGNVTLNSDGTGSIVVWVPGTGSNPASWQTIVHIDYPDRNAPSGRATKSFGPFTITANANLADLVAEMPVQPEYEMRVLNRIDGVDDHGSVSGAITLDSDISTHWLDATGPTVLTLTDGPAGEATRYVSVLVISGASDVVVDGLEDATLTDGAFATFAWVRGAWMLAAAGGSTGPADTTPPTGGSVSYTGSSDARTVTTTGWTDPEGGLHATPYRFSLDGTAWTAWQAGTSYNYTSIPVGTYTPQVQARNAAGLTATASATSSFTVTQTYRAAVLTDAPVYYFPLDDATGTTNPVNLGSVAAASMLVGAGATFGVDAGLGDGATTVHLDNSPNTKIRIATSSEFLSNSSAATIEALVKSSRTANGGYENPDVGGFIIARVPPSSAIYAMDSYQQIIAFGQSAGTDNGHWAKDVAYHMAVTFDGLKVRFYRNGTQIAAIDKTGALATQTGEVSIGGGNDLGTSAHRGSIGGVAMYDKVLTPARILAHAQAAGYA